MRIITEIIIHCSATPEGKDFHASDIDRWHKAQGWRKIGYHYVIDLDGTVEKGREDWEIGAHCLGHNENSIGICYIGGMSRIGIPKDTRTDAQKYYMRELVEQLRKRYPLATIHGHREFARKACPCFDVKTEYNEK